MKIKFSLWTMTAVALLGFTVSCSKSSSPKSSGGSAKFDSQRTRTQIPLESLQAGGGCLNVERLAGAYRELSPTLSLFEVTTKFHMGGGQAIRDEFRLLTAFGTFKFESRQGFERVDMHGLSQDGCRTISVDRADGTRELMRITQSAPEFVTAESQEGNRRTYRWLGPQRVEVSTRYKAYDMPCTERHSFVDVTQVLDWSPAIPDIVDQRSPLYVDDGYVNLLANATGRSAADFYREVPGEGDRPAQRVQLTPKLIELARGTVRQELISCNGATPPQPPSPEDPPENPGDPFPPAEPPAPGPEEPFDPERPRDPDPEEDDEEEDDEEEDDDDLVAL